MNVLPEASFSSTGGFSHQCRNKLVFFPAGDRDLAAIFQQCVAAALFQDLADVVQVDNIGLMWAKKGTLR